MKLKSTVIALSAAALAGCGGGGGGSDAVGGTDSGTVSFQATDAPVDNVSRVQITFDRIELQHSGEGRIGIDLDPPVVIENLLDLQGNNAAPILGDTTVPAGEYEFVRLFIVPNIPDSFVDEEEPGGRQNLLIPGQQGGGPNDNRFLQLSSGFVVPAGGDADFTIDVQLHQALVQPQSASDYFLRPSLRLVNNVEVGTISGTVDASLLDGTGETCVNDNAADGGAGEGNVVYLYTGTEAAVGDVNVNDMGEPDHASDDTDGDTVEVNPLTTANVLLNSETGNYEYTIGFVEQGDYSIAFTCQGLNDMPDTDEGIEFVQPTNVSVTAGQTTVENFEAAAP